MQLIPDLIKKENELQIIAVRAMAIAHTKAAQLGLDVPVPQITAGIVQAVLEAYIDLENLRQTSGDGRTIGE